jgi:hypothetical protein
MTFSAIAGSDGSFLQDITFSRSSGLMNYFSIDAERKAEGARAGDGHIGDARASLDVRIACSAGIALGFPVITGL